MFSRRAAKRTKHQAFRLDTFLFVVWGSFRAWSTPRSRQFKTDHPLYRVNGGHHAKDVSTCSLSLWFGQPARRISRVGHSRERLKTNQHGRVLGRCSVVFFAQPRWLAGYGKGFDTETLELRGRVPEFLKVFEGFGRFPWAPGRLSYPPGLILGSVFLWRCFRRQQPA